MKKVRRLPQRALQAQQIETDDHKRRRSGLSLAVRLGN